MSIKQQLKLKASQKLSPSQIQLMKLIELPTLAFEEKVFQALEENLVLEEEFGGEERIPNLENSFDSEELFSSQSEEGQEVETPKELEKEDEFTIEDFFDEDQLSEYKSSGDYEGEKKDPISFMSSNPSFEENLKNQLYDFPLSREDFEIAEFILSSIDPDGYLRRDFEDLIDDLAIVAAIETTKEKIEYLLTNYIHKLEPAGIGARNPKESLLIQLRHKKQTPLISLAIKIIETSFEDFYKKHYEKIQQKFSLTQDLLKEVINEIENLSAKPGTFYLDPSQEIRNVIIPDFILNISNGQLQLSLESRNSPKLKISPTYQEMFENYKESIIQKKEQKKFKGFIKEKIDEASSFLDAIKQREETLLLTMGAILDYQKDYFLSGDEQKLRPMTLKDIASIIKMDVSTISRVASQKYIYTPYGTFLIKNFFSESTLNQKGEEISTIEVKKVLKELIDQEDKKYPLTDEKLLESLKSKGYIVARRTVAKYREQMGISVARLRKKLI